MRIRWKRRWEEERHERGWVMKVEKDQHTSARTHTHTHTIFITGITQVNLINRACISQRHITMTASILEA